MTRGQPHSAAEVAAAVDLIQAGLSDYEVARRTGLPRSTVLNWRRGGRPRQPPAGACPACTEEHDLPTLPAHAYAYLLGQYLGDGTLFRTGPKGRGLRIYSDSRYPGIIEECRTAIVAVSGREPRARKDPQQNLLTLTCNWRAWPCLLPHDGPGKKHHRRIALADWQVELVEAAPGSFVRGLIHSDGWRGVNRVHVKGRDYEYPRYQFSNRSDDIRDLFCWACDLLGVAWRPWGRWHVSVARREAVALLDRFVGPKC